MLDSVVASIWRYEAVTRANAPSALQLDLRARRQAHRLDDDLRRLQIPETIREDAEGEEANNEEDTVLPPGANVFEVRRSSRRC